MQTCFLSSVWVEMQCILIVLDLIYQSFNTVVCKCLCKPNWTKNVCCIHKQFEKADFLHTYVCMLMKAAWLFCRHEIPRALLYAMLEKHKGTCQKKADGSYHTREIDTIQQIAVATSQIGHLSVTECWL